MSDLAAGRTSVPGLEPILGGSLPPRGIAFVIGAPGTGKTLLVQQLAFAAASSGRPALYFSGLSEPHERLVEHLRPFAFFDEALLGSTVQFLSLHSALEEGTETAVTTVMQTTRQARASLVIVDGFRGLRELIGDDARASGFLYRLGTQIGMLGALLIVVLEGNPHAEEFYPELAASDILIGLFFERTRIGHRRYLEVFKRRGSAHLPGLHALTIGPSGITCYPQFEMVVPPVDVAVDPASRLPFGVPDLDAMVGGGLTRQTMTIVAGNFGTGKTLLGLHFLAEGAARGEPGLLLSFRESNQQILTRAADLGMPLAHRVDEGSVRLLTQPPIVLDPDILAHSVRQALAESGARRMVVDSLAELLASVGRERAYGYLTALVTMLRGQGVTGLLIIETSNVLGGDVQFSEVPISVLGDNVLLLRNVESNGELRRLLSVLKMRFSDHERTTREFIIDKRGLTLLGRWSGAASAGDSLIEHGGGDAPSSPSASDVA